MIPANKIKFESVKNIVRTSLATWEKKNFIERKSWQDFHTFNELPKV